MATNPTPQQNGEQDVASDPTANGTQQETAVTGPNPPPPSGLDARIALAAKDVSLKDFLNKMDDYAPIVGASCVLGVFMCRSPADRQIPDAVTNFYMTKAGLPPPPQTDARLARLLALATQKFVADIAADAYQYSRVRASNTGGGNNPMGNLAGAAGFPLPGQPSAQPNAKDQGRGGVLGVQRPGYGGGGQGSTQNRTVLTMEDLGMAVGEYGVNVKRSEFYR